MPHREGMEEEGPPRPGDLGSSDRGRAFRVEAEELTAPRQACARSLGLSDGARQDGYKNSW